MNNSRINNNKTSKILQIIGISLFLFQSPHYISAKRSTDNKKCQRQSLVSFEAKASDSNTFNLDETLKKHPYLFLYFIKATCPMNAKAMPFIEQIYKEYKNPPFWGVINLDNTDNLYTEWSKQFKASYPILFDENLHIIKNAGIERSPHIIMINKNKEIIKSWKGYSKKILHEINHELASVLKVSTTKILFKKAPKKTKYGCPFIH